MSSRERIYLTGMMGSGKTTLGRMLADRMQWTFVDLDDNIESMSGMTIPNLFAEKGEMFFRDMESRALKEASMISECVVALGGGALLRAENLHQVLQNGTVVYLRLTEQAVMDRLSKIRSDARPLLSGDLTDEGDHRMDHEQRGQQAMLLRERLP